MPKTWYNIKAMGGGVAEVLIYEEIGGWGISAKEFARDLKDLGTVNHIDLRINSPGRLRVRRQRHLQPAQAAQGHGNRPH